MRHRKAAFVVWLCLPCLSAEAVFFSCKAGSERDDLAGTPRSCSHRLPNTVAADFDVYRCTPGPLRNTWVKTGRLAAVLCPEGNPAPADAKVRINCFRQPFALSQTHDSDLFARPGSVHDFTEAKNPDGIIYASRAPVLTVNKASANALFRSLITAHGALIKQGRHPQVQTQACALQCFERELQNLGWKDEASRQAFEENRKQIAAAGKCQAAGPVLLPAGKLKGVTELSAKEPPPVPKDIQTLLKTPACRNCHCFAPSGDRLCNALSYGYVLPDGTPAVNSSDPKATRAWNLCHFGYTIDFAGRNCEALNNTTCRGYGFVGTEVQPTAPGEFFDRPGWQEFTNGLVRCEAGPPRAAALSEYQGAARLNYLVPVARIEAQGAIPPPAAADKEAEPHDTHD